MSERYLRADNAECYVITACIMGANSFYRAQGAGITDEHFFSEEHRQIFAIVAEKSRVAKEWDCLTLVDQAPANIRALILDYVREGFGSAAIEANCAVVIAAHTARSVKNAGLRIAAISEAGPEALAQAQAELNAIGAGESSQIEDMRAVMTKVMDGISRRYNSGAEHFGLPVGISRLDTLLGGLSPGLNILAARPSMGKTAFVLQCAANVAINATPEARRGVFIGSLEMGSEPLGRRLVAQIGRINGNHLKKPKLLTEDEWPRLSKAASDIKNSSLMIWEKSGVTPSQMAGQMYRAAATGKIGLFVVDHIGILRLDQRANRSNALGEASMLLKKVSMETGIPLLVLSQLNRMSTDEPTLKDLRDSGELEQNADAVIFLHRPSYYLTGGASKNGICKVIVAKQRDGETGVVDQYWYAPWQRFFEPTAQNYADEEQAQEAPKRAYKAKIGGYKK